MLMSDHLRPVAICTHCGSYLQAEKANLIGERCVCDGPETSCRGTYRRAGNPADWRECAFCSGRGFVGQGTRCLVCRGAGWECVLERAH